MSAVEPWDEPPDELERQAAAEVAPRPRLAAPPRSSSHRVPPHDLDAERALLGALLLSRDAIPAVAEVVPGPEVFYRPAHAHVYEAITALASRGEPADPITVADELRRRDLLDVAGGRAALVDLQADAPGTANAAHYARIVADRAMGRRLIEALTGITQRAYDGVTDARALTDDAAAAIATVVGGTTVAEVLGGSWHPVDLAAVLAADDPPPAILTRTDGVPLLYRGRLSWLSGEPECGKGWIAHAAGAEVLVDGGRVAYIDFEDDAQGFVARQHALGLDATSRPDQIRYVRPTEPLSAPGNTSTSADRALADLCAWQPQLVIIDGCTEAMSLEGLDLERNRDVAAWLALVPRRLADAGAAVLVIDHVTKSTEGRGRWAIGGQHKLAGIDGAAFTVERVRPFGRSIHEPIEGLSRLYVAKDRRGHLRAHGVGDKATLIADVSLTSYPDGGVAVHLRPPGTTAGTDDHQARVVTHLQIYDGASKRDLMALGNTDSMGLAVKALVAAGHVEVEKAGRSHLHHLTDAGRSAWADTLAEDDAA